MSRVPVGKVLLRNVIRHTGAHNKVRPGPGAGGLSGPLSSLSAELLLPGSAPCPLPRAAFVRGSERRRPGHHRGVAGRRGRGPGLPRPPRRSGERAQGARCDPTRWEQAPFPRGKELVEISCVNSVSLGLTLLLGSRPGEGTWLRVPL